MNKDYRIEYFNLHAAVPGDRKLLAGNIAVKVDDRGRIMATQFRYTEQYREARWVNPLSPLGPKIGNEIYTYESTGRDFPGFIDDILPDDWGRKIIATRLQRRHVDTLTVLKHIGAGVSTGAYRITTVDGTPNWELGIPYERAMRLAIDIYNGDIDNLGKHADDVALLLRGGSGTGGARPKLLVTDFDGAHILKLNKKTDEFNTAGVEWASLELMRLAGLDVAEAKLTSFANDIDGILVKRFDFTETGDYLPMATINGLLKNPADQEDPLFGTYEDIACCIRHYSYQPDKDLLQLFGQLLINQALANTDDHLRNFSMIKVEDGWRLSPAYDVLPQQLFRAEHAIGFGGSNYLPNLKNAAASAKILGISTKRSKEVLDGIYDGLKRWPMLLESAGVDHEGMHRLIDITQRT